MKKLLLASVGIAVLALSGTAGAADLSRPAPAYRAPPPVMMSVYNWTGCYIGGNVGGLWASKDWSFNGVSDGTNEPTGFMGGGQIGCDFQFGGGFVIGLAGDYDWTNADDKHNATAPRNVGFTDTSKINGLASLTGRVGYAWDRFLGYVKGGGAWEWDEFSYSNGTVAQTATTKQNRTGWTVGIGGEYAFTNFLTGFVEYDYYDFGKKDVAFFDNVNGPSTYSIKEQKSVVKAGLNFRWGGATPVVARY